MRTVIIGGGKGCRAIIDLALGSFLKELTLDIICVVDIDPNAEGFIYAREQGIKTSTDMYITVLKTVDIELIIELTGDDNVLREIQGMMKPGTRLFDHTFAHIFWDLVNAREERKRQLREMTALEQKIEKEWHFLQSLFNTIPDPVVVLNKEKSTIMTNLSFQKFSGTTSELALGKSCEELLATTELADKCNEAAPLLDELLKTGESQTMIWQTPPPEETYWEVTRTAIRNKDGQIGAILGMWHRITEKVRLRHEIESAERRFKSFIDSADDWISIKDNKGRYVIVNPVVANAFHRRVEDFIGKTADDVLPPDLAKIIKMHDKQVAETKRHLAWDEIVLIDGVEHHFQAKRFPLTDHEGSVTGTCTIMRDVSSEKDLQNQLVQAGKLAAVGQLAAGVAHEINNPLTGILAFAEDMKDELSYDDPHFEDVKVIIRETLRCRDIVRNLLDFARQEAPKLENVDPNGVIDQALSLIEKLPQFRNVGIRKNKNTNIPHILGDSQQLQQVLLNLMLNAAEAMHGKGTIILTTEYDRRHDRCVILVEDDGPGIPENLIDRIFEPFFSTKGTNGLGLAVSWGIVERHHGNIEVDIADNGGAIFRILLPATYVKKKK